MLAPMTCYNLITIDSSGRPGGTAAGGHGWPGGLAADCGGAAQLVQAGAVIRYHYNCSLVPV